MHYYKFDISAWALHTAHLNPEEEAVYFRLVNFYYDTEAPIPKDFAQVVRRLRLTDYQPIVRDMLNEFFTATPDGFTHTRCDRELAAYHAKADKNREVGKLGGRPKKNPLETQSVSSENPLETLTTNYKLETTNYKPKEKNKAVALLPVGVLESTWHDFIALRKTKKAPVTQTALDGIAREATKAGISLESALRMCCERGWTGFRAEWIDKAHPQHKTPSSGNLAAARAIFGDERKLQDDRTIDISTTQIAR